MDSHERVPLSPHSVHVSPRTPKLRATQADKKKLSGIGKKVKPKRLRKSSDHVTFPELYLIKKIGPKAAAAQFSQDFDEAYKNALEVAQSENPSWFSASASGSDSDSASEFEMPLDIAILEYTEFMKLFSSLSASSSSPQSSSPQSSSSSESGDESMSPSPRPISPYMGGINRKKNKTKKNKRKNKNTYRRRSSKKHNQRKKQSLKHGRK